MARVPPPAALVVATKTPVLRMRNELPASTTLAAAPLPAQSPMNESPASTELAAAPEETAPPAPATPREPEVDFLRRAQAALASSPSEALKMADDYPSVYPRGILAQEREVIAIDALARLGRRREAALRAEAFRSAFPRSAHLSRLAALTEKP